jgi:hypothetical protein
MDIYKKEKEKGKLATDLLLLSLLLLLFCRLLACSFFLSLFCDLPPFLATIDLVFLLADASPFLLDFFLVAFIS